MDGHISLTDILNLNLIRFLIGLDFSLNLVSTFDRISY